MHLTTNTMKVLIGAALADGHLNPQEKQALRTIMQEAGAEGLDLLDLLDGDAAGRLSLADLVREITAPTDRQELLDLAMRICQADGVVTPEEEQYLQRLRDALGLPAPVTPAAALPPAFDAAVHPADSLVGTPADLDAMINKYAMIAGAMEFLPQKLATLGILPLQLRLVYLVGKAYGYSLDAGHVREFVATLGLGYASQVAEQLVRKLGRALGGGIGGAATGAATSYATTYALGQAAKAYYAGGRKVDLATLRRTYDTLVAQGRTAYSSVRGEVEALGKGNTLAHLAGLK